MEKIRNGILCVMFCLFCISLKAEEPPIIRKGLLRSTLTISPAILFKSKQSFFYLHGNLEGYVSPKLSLTGEAYCSLGNASSGIPTFTFNHNLFFGASYHIVKKNNDFYFGLQPGIAITRLYVLTDASRPTRTGANPVVAMVVGYNYYVHRYFHFFVQTRVVAGQHLFDVRKDLSEFRFSGGLGFYINAIKK